MIWIVLIAIALLAYQQDCHYKALLVRLDDINTDVEAITKARKDLQDFIRRRVTERVSDFKPGGGRERLRQRLQDKAAKP